MFQIKHMNGETWLICGGRDFTDESLFHRAMYDLTELYGLPSRVVHGSARGADTLAKEWLRQFAIEEVAIPADWESHGRRAGPMRNHVMLREKPNLVVAFPGGRGTAHMVAIAREAGINVAEIRPTPSSTRGT